MHKIREFLLLSFENKISHTISKCQRFCPFENLKSCTLESFPKVEKEKRIQRASSFLSFHPFFIQGGSTVFLHILHSLPYITASFNATTRRSVKNAVKYSIQRKAASNEPTCVKQYFRIIQR